MLVPLTVNFAALDMTEKLMQPSVQVMNLADLPLEAVSRGRVNAIRLPAPACACLRKTARLPDYRRGCPAV